MAKDQALDWLLKHDPAAQGRSAADYGRIAGILTPARERAIREVEHSLSEIEDAEPVTETRQRAGRTVA